MKVMKDLKKFVTGLALMAAMLIAPSMANAALVSYWDFEGDLEDQIGGIDGIAVDGATTTVDGTRGGVLTLDGVNDYMTTASTAAYNFGTSDFTWSFWVKAPVNTSSSKDRSNFVVYDKGSPDWNGYTIQEAHADGSGSTQYFRAALDGGASGDSSQAVTSDSDDFVLDDTWHHVAFVVSGIGQAGGKARLYKDGVEVAVTDIDNVGSVDTVTSPRPLYVGSERNNGNEWLDGSMDDLAVWNEALSPSLIAGLASGGLSPLTVPEPSSIILTVLGLLGSVACLRRKRRK